MKQIIKKKESAEDDSLFGLLASYKNLYSYITVIESPEQDIIAIIIAKNPSTFDELVKSKYQQFKPMRKIKIGVTKLFIKYITPEFIIKYFGPLSHNYRQILLCSCNRFYGKVFHQYIQYSGRYKGWQGWSQTNIFYTQIQ